MQSYRSKVVSGGRKAGRFKNQMDLPFQDDLAEQAKPYLDFTMRIKSVHNRDAVRLHVKKLCGADFDEHDVNRFNIKLGFRNGVESRSVSSCNT